MGGARFRITGIGRALPERVVLNEEIAARLGVAPEWIETRTGIRARRFAAEGESPSTLGTAAAREALAGAGVGPEDVDLIVVATCTADYHFPPTATLIQDRLGARTVGSFDVNAACSGFIYGLSVAASMLETGAARRVLLVGTEVLSRFTDQQDPVTAPLFGDGAGALVLEPDPEADPLVVELGSDGAGAVHVGVPAGGSRLPATPQTVEQRLHFIKMAGREVYRSAVRTMTQLGVSLGAGGFDLLIAHQANRRILEDCAGALGIGMDRVYMNIDRYGNTSSASIPIAMHEAWETGRLRPGDRLLLLAFGAGYTWAGASLRWGLPNPLPAREGMAAAETVR